MARTQELGGGGEERRADGDGEAWNLES